MNMILEIFQYQFLTIAFIGALLSAASISLLSPFVVLKKVSYMGEALAHVSFAGIGIGLFFGWPLNLVAILFVVIIAIIIGMISEQSKIEETHITTIFLSVSMAIGIIFISLKKGFTLDLASYLFGNILLISNLDLLQLMLLFVLNFFFIFFFYKELFYISYDQEISYVYKIPVKLTYYLFLIFIAVNIVVSVKIVGIILITAQFILPGLTALNLCHSVRKAILVSIVLSEIATISGFFISYHLDIPSGATIVIILFLLFLLSLIQKNRQK
ncbi:MAG: metal ABC transporter permease [Spirochaetes bacterium]|nr:metal ABC transporter permease [Spirochaetota bacterium]